MQQQEVDDILTFLRRSKGLESIKRYGSSLQSKQNSVAEHSWRLGLMALVIAHECKVSVDMSRTLSLALLHDIAEAKTGDIDAYDQIVAGKQLVEDKTVMEESAMHELTGDVSFGGWVYSLWREYEDQITIEAKFVKALDRIEGFLHIAESGVEAYLPTEFHADYANSAVAAFDEATGNVIELKGLLDAVKEDLHRQFDERGVKWVE